MQESGAGSRSALVIVAACVVAAIGVALLVAGVTAFGRASDTRTRAAQLRRDRQAIVARTRNAERDADSPIGRAEKVAASVSAIVDAGDAVITKAAATNLVLSRAVGLANGGDRAAAHQLYIGEGADSVRQLNDDLARARAALSAAQQAVADLRGTAP